MRFAPHPLPLHPLPMLALVVEPSCSDSGWSCTAAHLLHWLWAIAIVLAVVLILVTALAIRLWHKNKDSDEPR